MRLTDQQILQIKETVAKSDTDAQVWIYGSRVDDTARGGDIDLLVISKSIDFEDKLKLRMHLRDALGGISVDLIVQNPDEEASIFQKHIQPEAIQL